MPEPTYGSIANDAHRTVSSMADRAADLTAEAKDTLTDIASRARQKASEFSDKAKDGLGATAKYFRERPANDMASDFTAYVKENPMQALLGAAALGFLAGALLRRR